MTPQQACSATSRSSRYAANSIWHSASSSPRAQRRAALPSASDRHRPRGRLIGGLLGNRAAAKRLPPPGLHRAPARDCLSEGVATPRIRADRPRPPTADVRVPAKTRWLHSTPADPRSVNRMPRQRAASAVARTLRMLSLRPQPATFVGRATNLALRLEAEPQSGASPNPRTTAHLSASHRRAC